MKRMLRIENISKTFNPGTANATKALDRFSLTVESGEFLTVIGGNGSGKSTMLNAIAGIFEVDEGRITLDSADITYLPEYKRAKNLGRVFQDPMVGTASELTICENLAIAVRRGQSRGLRMGVSAKEKAKYKDVLAQLNLSLEDRLATKVGILSGGQRQALTLLMSTLKQPKLLLLDEHTAALDPRTAARVMELSETIVKRDNLSTIMITHNMHEAIRYGDRLIMMHAGKIVFEASGDEKHALTVRDLVEKFSAVSMGDMEAGNR
jgi:putative ABC transport system ATP-binding protein